jgi:hypothetical protein
MPWTPDKSEAHTKKADSPKKKRMWADVANSALSRTGSDSTAIKEANAVVGRYKSSDQKKSG